MWISFAKFQGLNDQIASCRKVIREEVDKVCKLQEQVSELNRQLNIADENNKSLSAYCDDLSKQLDAAREAKRQAIQQLSRANGDKVNLERLVCELEKRERLFHE